jgi:SAM-dependent methyltransferase
MIASQLPSPQACPVCAGTDLQHGMRQDGVPVHSVVLHRSRNEAISQACGVIDLVCCKSCGLVFNAAFDASLQHYRHDYEATQSFSGTFNAFNRQVAREVAKAAAGREGIVVEVGCGQGEFLALLQQHGITRSTGFDPAFDPARSAVFGSPGISVVDAEFDAAAVSCPVAAVVCKMTLEHIARPVEFLAGMADLARRNDGAPVVIQVPNAEQVFRSLAFWDVYYEHCNYFTRHSLNTALRRAGLAVDEMNTGFDDQYLLCRASPSGQAADHRAPSSPDGFDDFCAGSKVAINKWQVWAEQARADGGVALWGGGSKAVAFLSATGLAGRMQAAIDINPRKAGTFLAGSGVPVVSPQQAADMNLAHVLLLNPVYRDEVSQTMAALGMRSTLTVLGTGASGGRRP